MKYGTLPIHLAMISTGLFAIFLVIGQIVYNRYAKMAKLTAYFSLLIAFLLFFYLAATCLLILICAINQHWDRIPVLGLFLLSPFVIGHFCSYPKLTLCTWIQILVLSLNFVYIFGFTVLL